MSHQRCKIKCKLIIIFLCFLFLFEMFCLMCTVRSGLECNELIGDRLQLLLLVNWNPEVGMVCSIMCIVVVCGDGCAVE